MKLAARQIGSFLKKPDAAIRAVLTYGPDAGLVRERAEMLARTVVPDAGDPFRISDITAAALASDPGLLADEAAALSFTGGRRLVTIRDASDRLTRTFADFLKSPVGEAFVLIEAGDLDRRSSLRTLFETAANGAALPCYGDDGTSLGLLIDEVMGAARLRLDAAARQTLIQNLGGDRGVSRQELEKLVTYMSGPSAVDASANRAVTLADVLAVVGDSSALALDDVVDGALSGDAVAVERALTKSLLAGEAPVAVLRAALRHGQRLHLVLARIEAGETPVAALRALRPPLHFRRQAAFHAQLRRWSRPTLEAALGQLWEAEIACKNTGAPDVALARAALLKLARGRPAAA